jgi:hypothetical protein
MDSRKPPVDLAAESFRLLVLCGYALALFRDWFLQPGIPLLVLTGVALLALVYLRAGLKGVSAGLVEPGKVQCFWPAMWGAAYGVLLAGQFYVLPRAWGAWTHTASGLAQGFLVASLAACILRLLLLMRPAPTNKLPTPEELGLPMSGPASPGAAHASLNAKGAWQPPKFYD